MNNSYCKSIIALPISGIFITIVLNILKSSMKKLFPFLSVFLFIYSGNCFSQCLVNVDFNTWSRAGLPANGNWGVQTGGTSVLQTVNGDNTFFISPFDMMNMKVSGSFRTTDSDDDFIGFVWSFLDPMGATDDYDMWLFDWKQITQTWSGETATQGMAVSRVLGNIPISQYAQTFWGHNNTPEFTVVQNNWGSPGWQRNVFHDFELRLTYTKAMVYVDGDLKFDITDCFKSGRFGFYNYSQPSCTYTNFQYDLFIDFSLTDQKKCAGDSTEFLFVNPCFQSSLSQYQKLEWDFGDGTTQINNNPTFANANVKHKYTNEGTYTVKLTVTDFNGCSASATNQIEIADSIELTSSIKHPLCNGDSNGEIAITATKGFGPYTYTWNSGQSTSTINSLSDGTYSVTVTDGICTTNKQYVLIEPTKLTATSSHTDVSCNGKSDGSITVNTSGGVLPYSFLGNPLPAGAVTIPNLAANTYAGNIVDSNNCTFPVSETISEPDVLTLGETHTDVSCNDISDGNITISISGGTTPYNFNWGGGVNTQSRSNIRAGSYSLTVTDTNSCSDIISITITEPAPVPLSITSTDAPCFGSMGNATASPTEGTPPHTFVWSNSTSTSATASLPAGAQTVTSTASNGCKQAGTLTINQPTEIAVAETHTDVDCFENTTGSVDITASGGAGTLHYQWLPNVSSSNTADNIAAGSYEIIVSDDNSCTKAITVVLTEPDLLQLATTNDNVSCFELSDGKITATASGGNSGYDYTITGTSGSLNSTSGVFSNLIADTYTVEVSDAKNCTTTTTLSVTQPDILALSSLIKDATCYHYSDGNVQFTATGGTPDYSYSFSTGANNTSGFFANLNANNYSVTVTDKNNCSETMAITITEPDSVAISIAPNPTETTLGEAQQLTLTTNHSGVISYQWIPATGLSCNDCENPVFEGIRTITYHVLATTDLGCNGSSQVTATVIPDYTVFIPNTFSPNNDGSNDFFQVYGNVKAIKLFELKVFDRWGNKVYESNNIHDRWDGYSNGKKLPSGVYVYISKCAFVDGYADKIRKGTITIWE